MAKIIVIHGAPGAGKSTHSKRLAELSADRTSLFHVSAGNRLRDIRTGAVESRYSQIVNSPDAPSPLDHEVVNGIMFELISQYPKDSIVLVDGYPRLPDAVGVFLKAVKEGNNELLGCINLNISLETSIKRSTQRGVRQGERMIGEMSEFAAKRYGEYLTFTNESLRRLSEIAPLINISAEGDEDAVWEIYTEAVLSLSKNSK